MLRSPWFRASRVVALLCLLSLIGAPAAARSLRVTPEPGALELALALSLEGDTLRLAPGLYGSSPLLTDLGPTLFVLERPLTLIGEDGAILHGGLTARLLLVEPEAGGSVLQNLELRGGLAWAGGALYSRAAELMLRHCTLSENVGQCEGGAIFAEGGNLALATCIFESNRAGERGGALYLAGGAAQISASTFIGDDAARGGSLFVAAHAQAQLESCLFVDGSAAQGGWACVDDGFLSARQSTFFGLAVEPESGGILLRGERGSAFLETSILCFAGGPALLSEREGAAMLMCCNIYGNRGGDWAGTVAQQAALGGNLSANPAFCGLGRGNFGLDPRSPCAPANNPCGELIGALDVGCTDCEPEGVAAARSEGGD